MKAAILTGPAAENLEGVDINELTQPVQPDNNSPIIYKNIAPTNYSEVHKLYHFALYPHYLNDHPAIFAIPNPKKLFQTLESISDPPPVSCPLTGEKAVQHLLRLPQIKTLDQFKSNPTEEEIVIQTELDPDQENAAKHFIGPACVIAPAGSGKTSTAVIRIIILVKRNIKPDRILFITFTRKAQTEMQKRLVRALGEEKGSAVTVKTYHALAYSLLQHFAGKKINVLPNRYTTLQELVNEFGFDIRLENLDAYISDKMNNLVLPAAIQPQNDDELKFAEVYAAYINRLEKAGMVDQDYMLLRLYTELKSDPKKRKFLMNYLSKGDHPKHPKGRWQFVLVDESQDNNLAQDVLTRFFMAPWDNTFWVGDEDQLLYTFRGSSIDRILNISDAFPNLREIYLRTNYRSHPQIVHLANAVIQHNEKRRNKEIIPYRTDTYRSVFFSEFNSMMDELEWVAKKINKLLEAGKQPDNIAILYRVNTQGDAAAMALTEEKIPHFLHHSSTSLFETVEIETVLNHLTLLENPNDKDALLSCLKLPRRSWEPDKYEEILANTTYPLDYLRSAASEDRVTEFCDSLRTSSLVAKRLTDTGAMVHYIRRNFPDIDQYFHTNEGNDRLRIIEDIATKFTTVKDFKNWILRVRASKASSKGKQEGKVQLMTVHSAKGLEFDTVFLVNCTEGHFPHGKAYTKDAIEEERRIFYVGMTRAENWLYLSGYENEEKDLSRFYIEAHEAWLKMTKGSS